MMQIVAFEWSSFRMPSSKFIRLDNLPGIAEAATTKTLSSHSNLSYHANHKQVEPSCHPSSQLIYGTPSLTRWPR